MAKEKKQRYCSKCGRTKNEDEFYTTNNLDKYPDGRLNICKPCLTMHVDNWDSNTFLWILQECDIPYVPRVWTNLLSTYAKDKSTVTGLTIIGRYIGTMKLNQWKKYRWADTNFIQELDKQRIEETMKIQGYDTQEIVEAVNNSTVIVPEQAPPPPPDPVAIEEKEEFFQPVEDDDVNNVIDSLTEEDKLYLRMKWGKVYKPDEWVQLEKLYNEMMESYDIQTAGHIDTLKKICKTSLKADQLLDLGDTDAAQKMLKTYDMLMKSGKFTAAQNKADSDEAVDSVGELVAMCEKEGFIPRFYIDGPNDKVDKVIMDMQIYTRDLVTEELGLGNLIENAIQQLQKEKEAEDELKEENITLEEELFNYDKTEDVTDSDYTEFNEFTKELSEEDYEMLYEQLKEDER